MVNGAINWYSHSYVNHDINTISTYINAISTYINAIASILSIYSYMLYSSMVTAPFPRATGDDAPAGRRAHRCLEGAEERRPRVAGMAGLAGMAGMRTGFPFFWTLERQRI